MAFFPACKGGMTVTELLAPVVVATDDEKSLTGGLTTDFDFIVLIIGNKLSGSSNLTKCRTYETIPTSSIVYSSNSMSGLHYVTESITSFYQMGFSATNKLKIQKVANSDGSYPMYVGVLGININ